MRFLLISICLFLFNCASIPKKQQYTKTTNNTTSINNPYFANPGIDYVYQANINALNHSFSGVLIIKKIKNKPFHRIVFTSKMGNKLLDFSLGENYFKINFMNPKLNKKILINTLKKDFLVLITNTLSVKETFVKNNHTLFKVTINNENYFYKYNQKLSEIVKGKTKVKTKYLFSEINNNIANKINILHNKFNLTIQLNKIN